MLHTSLCAFARLSPLCILFICCLFFEFLPCIFVLASVLVFLRLSCIAAAAADFIRFVDLAVVAVVDSAVGDGDADVFVDTALDYRSTTNT